MGDLVRTPTTADNKKTQARLESDSSIYVQAATSHNTRRAYQADIADFLKKGGALPATPQLVESYLKKCAATYNPRTLRRRLTALRQWHKLNGVDRVRPIYPQY